MRNISQIDRGKMPLPLKESATDLEELPMRSPSTAIAFWSSWLMAVVAGVMFFGLGMVIAPGYTRQFFSLLLYGSAEHTMGFAPSAVAYVSLVHAVLGAVMFGWGAALLFAVSGPFRRGSREGWQTVVVSVSAWFIPDTTFSLWSGFWQNAVLNAGFLVLFAIPLAATYREFHERKT